MKAMSTRMDTCDNPLYMLFEIASEAGELQGKYAKALRKGNIEFNKNIGHWDNEGWLTDVIHELGDILWGIAGLADQLGYTLEEVADANLEKLASRKKRGLIEGEGDNR